jgi:hypothetical protein
VQTIVAAAVATQYWSSRPSAMPGKNCRLGRVLHETQDSTPRSCWVRKELDPTYKRTA